MKLISILAFSIAVVVVAGSMPKLVDFREAKLRVPEFRRAWIAAVRLSALDGGTQGLPEQAAAPGKPLIRRSRGSMSEQGGSQPALFSGPRVRQWIDLPHPLRHETVQRFQTVRGLEADPELGEDPEPVEGQSLLQPLQQAPGADSFKRRSSWCSRSNAALGRSVGRLLVGGLQLPPPGPPMALRQIGHDILALVPPGTAARASGREER